MYLNKQKIYVLRQRHRYRYRHRFFTMYPTSVICGMVSLFMMWQMLVSMESPALSLIVFIGNWYSYSPTPMPLNTPCLSVNWHFTVCESVTADGKNCCSIRNVRFA